MRTSENPGNSSLAERLQRFVSAIDDEIDKEYAVLPISDGDLIRKNTYCFALDKCKSAIIKMLNGREYYDKDDV